MEIIYTDHSRMRMKQRDITEKNVEMALDSPDRVSSTFGGRKCARKTIGDEMLEGIFVRENDRTVVVTTYWLEGD